MSASPFADLPRTPETHFKLWLYATILHLLREVTQAFGSWDAVCGQFPFLRGYFDELAAHGLAELGSTSSTAWWCEAVYAWEREIPGHLPLRALRDAIEMDEAEVMVLLGIGLIEEDARFGMIFEALQAASRQPRPTIGLLQSWWRMSSDGDDVRAELRRLQRFGLVQVVNPDAPRSEWILQVPGGLWDTLRGDIITEIFPWASYQPSEQLLLDEELIAPEHLRQSLPSIIELLASGQVRTLVVRGPQHNGRRTLLGAVARQLGWGLLEIRRTETSMAPPFNADHWKMIGPLATLLHAVPVIVLDLTPGETAELPAVQGYDGPVGIVLGLQGGLRGPSAEQALTVTLDIPDANARQWHWRVGLAGHPVCDLELISERLRMTSGNIRRTARLACSYAALAGRSEVLLADIQQASRALHRQHLETLATYVPVSGDWSSLAVSVETMNDLFQLETRCRHRERLSDAVGPALSAQLNPGVRALFSGPSGAGKTLAARLLASVLQKDLYRLDLSAVVNKYIGETEKNLAQVFARAEELDVILLLDEGDALLTQRTDVQNANDRYANLETNYLLQRIESFSGILLITTNAADRIDSAFQRRLDVVIDFRSPDAAERWFMWQLHLPSTHAVPQNFLDEAAHRCVLSGGQIRNIVLHAALLALDAGEALGAVHLEAALHREYRKAGAVCPLRRSPTLSVVRG